MIWTCPACGRNFAREKQAHSCRAPATIESHFAARPDWMREAYERLRASLPEGARIEAVGNGLHVAARSTYAGIKPRRDALSVEFILDAPVESPRIVKTEKLGPTRYAHHVDLAKADDVDPELLGWLGRAHSLRS